MVISNLMKALNGFGEQRLDTEGVIFVNGIIATFMILMYVRDRDEAVIKEKPRFAAGVGGDHPNRGLGRGRRDLPVHPRYRRGCTASSAPARTCGLGPQADWYVKPIQKTKPHN